MIYWPNKDPLVSFMYGINWAPTLAELGDPTIVDSSWEVISGNVTLGVDSIDGTNTAVRVNGGVDGEENVVRNTITTSDDDILVETAYIKTVSLGA